MLVNCDVKGLEVVVAAELSGDKVLKQEIIDKVDIHETNRDRFKLGEGKPGRLVAKIFKFRLIYGGSAYSYAHDSDFMGVSTSERFWQNVIDEYYEKYQGIKRWHTELMQTARATGRLEIPSGRYYPIEPKLNARGELKWPDTVIKNYPVQGFGTDLVMLARLESKRRLNLEFGGENSKWKNNSTLPSTAGGLPLLISTIHDSIVADCPEDQVEVVGKILNDSVEAVPALCKQVFGYEFSLPLTAEVQYGKNKLDMVELKW
jgi:DNA polymerase I-like protein with 3'-5' exonuclease and polymerase domains